MPKNNEINIDLLLDDQLGSADNARPNINRASFMNPDQQAEIITLAESRNLPTDTVENNLAEIKRREQVDLIDTTGYPKLSRYLTDDMNSRVSIDDIDNLKGIEGAVESNIDRSWGEFTSDIGIDLAKGVIGLGEATVGIADLLTFNLVGYGLEAIGYDTRTSREMLESFYSTSRAQANIAVTKEKGFVGTLGALVENPSVAFGTAVESLPMMIGIIGAVKTVAAKMLSAEGLVAGTAEATAFLSQPHIVSKLTMISAGSEGLLAAGSIQEGARAKGKGWIDSAGYAVLSGALTAAITRGASKLLPDVETSLITGAPSATSVLGAGKEIAKGLFSEGGLQELPQSTQEQIFSNLATDRPWDEGVPSSAATGLVTGSLVGGGMKTVQQVPTVINLATTRKIDKVISTDSEQGVIDTIATFAQSSLTRGRKEDRFRIFLKGLDTDKQVLISSDPLIDATKDGVELPTYITEQITGLGTDVAINIEQFAADIAPNEELMTVLRPHMKMSDETLTPAQIEKDEDLTIKSLLERAEKNQELKTESETIYEQVKDQIVDTGRQSEATARYSAAVIPAYMRHYAEGAKVSIKEAYEVANLSIVGPAAEVSGEVLEQAKQSGYEGEDTTEASEWQRSVDKGLDMSTEGRMARAKEQGFDIETTWYHGTGDLSGLAKKGFDPSFLGSGADQWGTGYYLTNEPSTASGYAEGESAGVIPARVRINNPLIIDSTEARSLDDALTLTPEQVRQMLDDNPAMKRGIDDEDMNPLGDHYDSFWESGPEEWMLDDLAEKYTNPNHLSNDLFDGNEEAFLSALEKATGYDGVIVNFPDSKEKFAIPFSNTQIRSVNAAFDPDFKDSPQLLAQSAYHGTPHKFDKFSLDAIGTGEGNQAYGWGLYFAGSKGISEWYRDELAGKEDVFKIGGSEYFRTQGRWRNNQSPEWASADVDLALDIINFYSGKKANADRAVNKINKTISNIKSQKGIKEIIEEDIIVGDSSYNESEIIAAIDVISAGNFVEEQAGSLIRVDIPEDNELLDWDKKLKDQPNAVITALMADKNIKNAWDKLKNWTGQNFYKNWIGQNSPVETSELMNSLGIKGLRYLDANSRDSDEDAHNYVIWDESAVTVEAVNDQLRQAFQKENGKTRATIQLLPEESIIKLHQASDLSSFLHESAHLFLEMEGKLAAASEVTGDQQVILDWLEVDSFDNITKEHHEKFAETFEVYFREGKAPSLALRDAFAAFKRWLIRIYQSLTDPRLKRAELTPEIREVFDRMLATEAEIELATANPVYDQFFKSKEQSGMSDAEWEAYQTRQLKAKNRATETLDTKLMKELTKRYTKEWNEEKQPLIDEEMERLKEEQVYMASDSIHESPMDRKIVKEIMGYDKMPNELRGKTISNGVDPQAHAEIHGYANVEAMINEIVEAPKLKDAANEAAEARMIEKYGDILNDGSIETEAREAVHNDAQAQLLLDEIKALKPERANKINRAYLKAEAKTLIGSMNFKEIKPNKYYRAEIKASQKAVTATDKDEQYIAKVQQLANHYMYREAVETKDRMVKQRKYVNQRAKKAYTKGVVIPEYAQNIQMLAKSYTMNDSTDIPYVINWMKSQLNDQNQFIDFDIYDRALIKMIDDDGNGLQVDYTLTKFDDMTAEELKGLHDQLKHMRFVGGKLTNEKKEELTFDREQASESIDKHSTKVIKPTHDVSKHQSKIDTLEEFFYSQRRIGGVFENLDGFEKDGAMAKEYSLINQASNKKLELSDKMIELMDDALKPVLKLINRNRKSTITKQDGKEFTLNHRARFTLGLNWGNTGNKEAVIQGITNKFNETFTEQDIISMLSTMTTEELNAINKTWEALETLWPELSGVETRLKGVAPSKVQAVPFTINGVEMTGGHYRLHYRKDPNDTSRSSFKDHFVADGKIKLGTASSANERVGSGGRQVDLDLGHLFTDLEENIHYITHAELAGHLNAMFKGVNNPVVNSLITGYGQPYYDNLIDTLSVITQSPDPVKGMWKWLRYVRMNLTYGFLIGSVRNVIQQPIAITNAFAQLGFTPVIKGVFQFYSNPVNNYENIRDVSPFMKNRTKLVNREAREQLMKIDSLHPKIGAMKNMMFLPQTFMDSLVAYPVWMAAYDKSNGDIKYADDMVAKTIGSGLSKDLGAIFSKGEAESQITFMGTFFNLTWNLHVENAQLLMRGKISGMEYAKRLGWMAVAPALLSMLMLEDVPEDDEEAVIHALKEIGYYNLSSVMVLRDIGTAMKGFGPTIPGLSFAKGVAGLGKEFKDLMTGDADLDIETTANIIRGMQPLFPMPASGQVIRTMKGSQDPNQTTWGKIVEGKDRN